MSEERGIAADRVPEMACAVCAEVLFPRTDHGEVVAYLHRGELPDAWMEHYGVDRDVAEAAKAQVGAKVVDHIAVPVPRDQVQAETRCDFCSGPRPRWVLPVASFEASPEHGMTKDWLACDVCARLLRKGRWSDLTKRAVLSMAAKYHLDPGTPQIVDGIKALHSQVREYQMGPPRRLDGPVGS